LAVVSAAQTTPTYEVVHRFRSSEASVRPDIQTASQSRLIIAPDGYLYGTTYWGGTSGFGTIYRMDATGGVTTLHSFAFADGANPAAGLVHSSDGAFYGTTGLGGSHNQGTVFRMDASGAVTRLHSFDGDGGQHPFAALIQASDGKFYGTTSEGGANGVGVVFRVDSSGVFELLHSFDRYVDGARPLAELIETRGGLYGTTREGGPNNQGTIFRLDFAGSITTVHAFAGPDGQYPVAALVAAASGDLYGTTSLGTVYRIDLANQLTTVHTLDSYTEGATPLAPLIQGFDGSFYGTASNGGYQTPVMYGTVFRLTDTGTLTVLHAFDGTDGVAPAAGLVQTSDGSFYGLTNSTYVMGNQFTGTVFRIDSSSGFTTLHSFEWRDGEGPSYLLPASDGFIYGSTGGGAFGHGTVFRMDYSGQVAILHNCEGGADGGGGARLMQASDGTIYGTDPGGANNLGRIFRLEASGITTDLHDFSGDDGAGPTGLVEGSDGKLYGTTGWGGGWGGAGVGTFFRIDTSGAFEGLGGFGGDYSMAYPNGPLVTSGGKFYGTTSQGCHGFGCIFEASAEYGITAQYGFAEDGTQGAYPLTPLIDVDGDLWGLTSAAGEFGQGTAFETVPGWADLDTWHSFTPDEGSAISLGFANGLFVTTGYSPQSPKGTIFSMDDVGNLTSIYSFPGQMDGAYPDAPVLGSDGFVYGAADLNLIYRLSSATVAVNQVLPTSGPAFSGALTVTGGGFADTSAVTIGGTPGSDLTVVDSTFLYLFTPALSPGTLNDVTVTNPGSSPAAATFLKAFFADFLDVPQTDPFHDFVEKIFRAGITAGCGSGSYCPHDAVTRAQMAVFLLKAEHGSGYVPPACTGVFGDVPCPSMFADWIEQLAHEGITAGCGGGNYCPSTPVTRAQMAVFLLKAEHGPGYAPPACTGVFTDVTCPSLFANWIEQLAAEGITGGCGGGNYCPNNPNTRGQMAVFLTKTFHL
jgi:uncharacterized repeat protein (TIGR03803 family)